MEMGALRVLECWGEDVPEGETTDFRKAVKANSDESIVFSWIEWPDRATRDAAMVKMMDPDFVDPRMDPAKNPMPFDGKRLIFGGFAPVYAAAWPTGEFGGMGLEGAVRLGYKKELEAEDDPVAREQLFQQLVARMYEVGKASEAASYLELDAVIDPADTRAAILRALAAARTV